MQNHLQDTIVALSTPAGTGALAVIRLSGSRAIPIADSVFTGADLAKQASHTLHFGTIRRDEAILDEVVASLFIAPRSFTREDVVEISCHGSPFIVQQLLQLLIEQGARPAAPGEFTKRAFLNGRFDLAQAEAVADLIASESALAHQTALQQMRGGFSQQIRELRERLVHFASLIELELDFSEEDVEFADRDQLAELVTTVQKVVGQLITSFAAGNVMKNGVPTVIAGKPNAGKSTLLNALLQEQKAIVSDVPGTTRDFIEDEITLEGIRFRFIDTAGIRETDDRVEALGVQRTHEKIAQASLILYMIDLANDTYETFQKEEAWLLQLGKPFVLVGNKMDQISAELQKALADRNDIVCISAEQQENLDALRASILTTVPSPSQDGEGTVVTSARHYASLMRTQESLQRVLEGIDTNISHDFLAQDIRHALHYLGEITGDHDG